MPPLEEVGQSHRIQELRPVETLSGVTVYRPSSIASQLVTEGTKSPSPETPVTNTADRGRDGVG
jgi:hypothetical protein